MSLPLWLMARRKRENKMIPEAIKMKEEKELFFYNKDENRELGCIGYLRGDFGNGGREFWTTWFPHHFEELNDEKFKVIFDAVINKLREPCGVLSDRESMRTYCRMQPQCRVSHPYGEQWGFRILTQDYALYLRCIPTSGDYNFYVFCYDKEMLMNKLASDRGLPRYCYSYLPTTKEEIRIDFAESGYTPYRKQGNGRAANEMNRELGISPAQAEAMKVGSMFGWDVPGADPKNYDENGKAIRKKDNREER